MRDVVIIGCGPAGAAAAAVLGKNKRDVVVLEREKFPRYHIGESLIPFTYQPLERIGMIPKLRASAFVKKYSVQFVSPNGNVSQPFYFNTRYPEPVSQTWQVLRSTFDQMLMQNAREHGAEVIEEMKVKKFLYRDERCCGVEAEDKQGNPHTFEGRVTIDCSGRESLAASRNNWRIKDPALDKIAIWTYYRGAKRDPGMDEGATTVAYVKEKGWFWYIPLSGDMVSVGVVGDAKYLFRNGSREPEKVFHQEVEENKWIKDHLATGKQEGNYYITGEFSFRSRFCATPGLVLAGDAYGFLDPIFSSGVMLALKSGVLAADAVESCFSTGNFGTDQFAEYGRTMKDGIENMRKLVYAFYDMNFSFRNLTDKYPHTAGLVTDCLSGDVNRDFTELFARCAELAKIPEELACGEIR